MSCCPSSAMCFTLISPHLFNHPTFCMLASVTSNVFLCSSKAGVKQQNTGKQWYREEHVWMTEVVTQTGSVCHTLKTIFSQHLACHWKTAEDNVWPLSSAPHWEDGGFQEHKKTRKEAGNFSFTVFKNTHHDGKGLFVFLGNKLLQSTSLKLSIL